VVSPHTPATIQRINNNGQPEARLPLEKDEMPGHAGKAIAKYPNAPSHYS
jgi:hypothetical protein